MVTETAELNVKSAKSILDDWQGHRRLTRKVIEAFPEDKLFQFSVGGMRPFSEMAFEFIRMAVPIAEGVATGNWQEYKGEKPTTKDELLRVWDAQTAKLSETFEQIPSANGKAQAWQRFNTPSTTRFTTAARAMSTCVRWASNLPISGSANESRIGGFSHAGCRWTLIHAPTRAQRHKAQAQHHNSQHDPEQSRMPLRKWPSIRPRLEGRIQRLDAQCRRSSIRLAHKPRRVIVSRCGQGAITVIDCVRRSACSLEAQTPLQHLRLYAGKPDRRIISVMHPDGPARRNIEPRLRHVKR
jgi:hypothetical protein